jgi:hypothetical protein
MYLPYCLVPLPNLRVLTCNGGAPCITTYRQDSHTTYYLSLFLFRHVLFPLVLVLLERNIITRFCLVSSDFYLSVGCINILPLFLKHRSRLESAFLYCQHLRLENVPTV